MDDFIFFSISEILALFLVKCCAYVNIPSFLQELQCRKLYNSSHELALKILQCMNEDKSCAVPVFSLEILSFLLKKCFQNNFSKDTGSM